MIARAASLALAGVLAVVLAGCVTPREPPPPPDATDLADVAQLRFDQAWQRSGLQGTAEKPDIKPLGEASFEALSECIAAAGVEEWMMSDGSDGVTLDAGINADADEQLALHLCFAQHPVGSVGGRIALSRDQLDYLYDYYKSWVIPCLALESVSVLRVPTREEFLSAEWQGWTPYNGTESLPSEYDRAEAMETCGDPYADLDLVGNRDDGSRSVVVAE